MLDPRIGVGLGIYCPTAQHNSAMYTRYNKQHGAQHPERGPPMADKQPGEAYGGGELIETRKDRETHTPRRTDQSSVLIFQKEWAPDSLKVQFIMQDIRDD